MAISISRFEQNEFRNDFPHKKKMSLAAFGCVHGKLNVINAYCKKKHSAFALCCGDFQSTRDEADLASMDALPKYRSLCDFPMYFRGSKRMYCPMMFVGGNHEAARYLSEFPDGGFVAPNIYYLGTSGVVQCGGLRIAGISGIYHAEDYYQPYEIPSVWDRGEGKRACHMRAYDIGRLLQIREPVDIVMSHDWPCNVFDMISDKQSVLDFFAHNPQVELERETFGSLPLRSLVAKLQPRFWICAHMHRKWEATIKHDDTGRTTNFIALGKVAGNPDDPESYYATTIPSTTTSFDIKYDPEWLNILSSVTFQRQKCNQCLSLEASKDEVHLTEEQRRRICATLGVTTTSSKIPIQNNTLDEILKALQTPV